MLSARVVGFTLILAIHVSSTRGGLGLPVQPHSAPQDSPWLAIRAKGNDLYAKGDRRQALSIYEDAAREAEGKRAFQWAGRFLNNAAGCRLAMFEYREAIATFLAAQRLARLAGDATVVFAISINLSSLYLQLGDAKMAIEATSGGLEAAGGRLGPEIRLQYLMQLGNIEANQGRFDSAIKYYTDGLQVADAAGDSSHLAWLWSNIGNAFLGRGDLDRAETAIYEGHRIRHFSKDASLALSYPTIGRVLLARGRPKEALLWFDKAFANIARLQATDPPWLLLHRRSKAFAALGREQEAQEASVNAMESMKRWRAGVAPADRLRVTSEEGAREVFDGVVGTASRLYLSTGGLDQAWRALNAVEESRAWSLRESLRQSTAENEMPPEYHEVLGKLRAEEASRLMGRRGINNYERLSLRLVEIESRSGLYNSSPGVSMTLPRVQAKLESGETLFSFHLGEPESWLWVVTRGSFSPRRIPGRKDLGRLTATFRVAVEQGSPEADSAGSALYEALFAAVPAAARKNPHWRLALDQDLFDLPFAALRETGEPGYLIERHSIQITPSVPVWLETTPLKATGRPAMLAIADPIYNSADSRLPRRSWLRRLTGPSAAFELPRLAGGAGEVRACASELGEQADLSILTGSEASEGAVRQALAASPSIIHFAAHVVPSPVRPDQGIIALSVGSEGRPGILNMGDIAALRIQSKLVVMNGCASGAGPVLPAAGLLGLTRAWLRAGARNVAATRWPVPDDSGEFFRAFYRHSKPEDEGGDKLWSSIAMQQAQRQCLRSGGWRAKPNYWAAFFTVGRD